MNNAIVVGGGILGMATAWRLAELGVRVTVIEAETSLAEGASRASFAWFNASNKPPRLYHQLNADGMAYYHRLRRELGEPRWLHFSGHVEWDGTEDGAAALRERTARLREWGYTAEWLPISELPLIEPDLVAPPHVDEFVYYPQEGYINPVDMVGELRLRAQREGADIRTATRVTAFTTTGERVTGVVTDRGDRLAADYVVSTTGAVSPVLLEQIGLSLPMAPTTGMVAVSSPTAVRLNGVHHNELMNIRPDGSGRIMMRHHDFDAMCEPGMPEVPIPAFMSQLLQRVVTVLPGLASARIDSMRVVTRPIPGDGYPVIGQFPGLEGLYLMVTHSAVTLGPMLGHIAAREITTGVLDRRLDGFRPDRRIEVSSATRREN